MSPHGAPGRGVFITIEGPEGAGKTSQAERLRDALAASGAAVVLTREPGGTALGERVREFLLAVAAGAPHHPRADALLFNAARAQLVAEVIEPALGRGDVVISTRFADSTLAYQGFGAGLPLDRLRALQEVATGGLTPDLTIVLDLPAEVGLDRKPAGDRTRFELGFDIEFHRRVRDGFLELAAADPARFAVVDAGQPADDVWDAVRTVVGERLGLEGSGEPDGLAARIHG